nr:ribonuclease HI family protein [Candidatus Dojkabacteria bacterium]
VIIRLRFSYIYKMEEKYLIYCDGGSRGNPGPAASAFVVTNLEGKLIYSEGKYLGIETNNVAEYEAVLLAVNWIAKKQISNIKLQITINLDSQLVERQLNGFYKIKSNKLIVLADKIKTIVNNNNLKITFVWGYREKNKLADSLVNETLDKSK